MVLAYSKPEMRTADPIGEQAWSIAENILVFDKQGDKGDPYRVTLQVARSGDSSHRTAPCALLRVPQKSGVGLAVVPVGEPRHVACAPEDGHVGQHSSSAPALSLEPVPHALAPQMPEPE